MRRRCFVAYSCLVNLAALTCASLGAAAPALRTQVDQRGDFVMIGNTLGWDCAQNTNLVLNGSVNCTGTDNTNDTAIDVYWRSDDPSADQALASSAVAMTDARSTAMLNLPAGARITYARMYWGAYEAASGNEDTTAVIEQPGTTYTQNVTADETWEATADGDYWYQSTADVTDLFTQAGPGAYRVSGVSSVADLVNRNSNSTMAGWAVVVFYALDSDPPRNLALFDGLDPVSSTSPQNATISGFLVPNAGYTAKLGVLAFEGDEQYTGDQFLVNGQVVSDALNLADNFFNATHSNLGVGVSSIGDLPRLAGTAGSLGGLDLDVVNITALVGQGDDSATLEATSSMDHYVLGAMVTSISTFKPDFSTSGKTVRDINGGALRPGDVLEYTVTAVNSGNDNAVNSVLTDVLPTQVTYVPNSLELVSPTALLLTDAAGDDTGEYDAGTITVRLGTGANATDGGAMAIGDTIVLRFQVTLNGDATGTIENQAIISAEGALGAPDTDFPTDGNGDSEGVPPTTTVVDECATDADCSGALPYCDTSLSPQVCVECVTGDHCSDPGIPDCNPSTHVCECALGAGNCVDTDGDGMSDAQEAAIGTDPNDADSDDDGVPDGSEIGPGSDNDGDGLINALDPDSDNDGLFDGTEMGLGCSNADTNLAARRCIPDADGGTTTTDPLDADTDGGGVSDGSEDANLNGQVDQGETNPTSGHSDDDSSVVDTDNDGLSDGLEATLGSDPADADSDNDGVLDGVEPNPSDDLDLDGLVGVLDPDSDDDGLFDGTEMGKGCSNEATDSLAGHCRPDADGGQSTTSPLLPDTDGGGVTDGSEDVNLDGRVDTGETNPVAGQAADDGTVVDTDGDGLSDGLEGTLGTDPNDADSDDDGVPDGMEPNPSDDNDGDGYINPLDPDSDNDDLFDGTELGFGCSEANGTDPAANSCIADGDLGQTWTSPLLPDTDRGGLLDGIEDVNHDGVIQTGERNPNDPSDDSSGCTVDADCGAADSGRICDASHTCVDGCRGTGGNGCPAGETCSSTDGTPGTCSPNGQGGAGGGAGAAGAAGQAGEAGNSGVAGSGGVVILVGGNAGQAGAVNAGSAGEAGSANLGGGAGAAGQAAGGQAGEAGLPAAVSGSAGLGQAGETAAAGQTAAAGTQGSSESGGEGTETVNQVDTGAKLQGGGCSCRIADGERPSHSWLALAFGALLYFRRRRSLQ